MCWSYYFEIELNLYEFTFHIWPKQLARSATGMEGGQIHGVNSDAPPNEEAAPMKANWALSIRYK